MPWGLPTPPIPGNCISEISSSNDPKFSSLHRFVWHPMDFTVSQSSTKISEPLCCSHRTCSTPQGSGPTLMWGPGQALRSSHLLHTDGLPHTGNKSRRRGAATHPSCALVCPRQTVTRAHTSPQALRSHTLEIVLENVSFKLKGPS